MNEQHQLAVWTTALNLPEYEVVHYAERDGVRRFSLGTAKKQLEQIAIAL